MLYGIRRATIRRAGMGADLILSGEPMLQDGLAAALRSWRFERSVPIFCTAPHPPCFQ
jgi:hypothetical protein